jgi:hypothetical protein
MDVQTSVYSFIRAISDILTAGIAITAFSLLLFALTMNLRDKVVRSFCLILVSVVIVFSAEAFTSTSVEAWQTAFWLRLQWVGIILLPALYFSFSDAVLETTGRPSRWRRRWASLAAYSVTVLFLFMLPAGLLTGPVVMDEPPAPHLQPTFLIDLFTVFYLVVMSATWVNFIRAYRRTVTPTSRRRMAYLLIGAMAPALGSYPFLLFGSSLAAQYPYYFWIVVVVSNILVGFLLVLMAYAVSFFGMPWPDRVVKGRLLLWMLRGPVTASITLALTTLIRRFGDYFGQIYTAWVPITMVMTIVILEYLITMIAPFLERKLFYGNDDTDLEIMDILESHLITRSDLLQFVEMILAAICDHLQAKGAYLVAVLPSRLDLVAKVGRIKTANLDETSSLYELSMKDGSLPEFFKYEDTFLAPIHDETGDGEPVLLGLLVISGIEHDELLPDQQRSLKVLTTRTGIALRDRQTQSQIFSAMESLSPQIAYIQSLSAAGRYDREGILIENTQLLLDNLDHWVKEALTHYWGGPRLTENPLLQLQVVQKRIVEGKDNPANALRAVLKDAIERLRPEGDRKYTNEWILYNLLVMKYLEAKKVKEIANKLSISEADLFRKQKVAIAEAGKIILEMEKQLVNG